MQVKSRWTEFVMCGGGLKGTRKLFLVEFLGLFKRKCNIVQILTDSLIKPSFLGHLFLVSNNTQI